MQPLERPKTLRATPTTSKMFALEQKYIMLLKFDDHVGSGSGPNLVAVSVPGLAALRLIEKSTGPNMKQCLAAASTMSSWAQHFKVKARITTTDEAPANFAAEREMVTERGDGWLSLHLGCNMHRIARSFARTFALLDEHITGLMNLSLVLGFGGTMLKFREAMVAIVESKLTIVKGSPPPEAQAYKEFMMDLFCSKGKWHCAWQCMT